MHDPRIRALKQQIAELESSLPAHSIPPSMLIRLEELEEELERLQREADSDQDQN
jgi:hypothetical protein